MKSRAANLIAYLKKLKKQTKGFTLAELAVMSLLLVVIAALGLDVGILIFSSDACDKACKDCARAAGTGRTPGQAIDAMNAALTTHLNGLGPMMTGLSAQLMVYEDYSQGTPNTTSGGQNGPWETTTGTVLPSTSSTTSSGGGTIPSPYNKTTVWLTNSYSLSSYTPGPYVVVRCIMTAMVPAPIFFWGSSITPNTIQVASVYSSPLINTFATVLASNAQNLTNPQQATSTSATSTAANATTTSSTNSTNTNSTNTNGTSNNSHNSTTNTTTNSTSTDQGSGTHSTSTNSTDTNSTNNSNHTSTTSSSGTSHNSTTNSTHNSTSTDQGSGTTNTHSSSSNSTSNTSNTSSNNTNTTGTNSTNTSNTNNTNITNTNATSTNTTNNTSSSTTGAGVTTGGDSVMTGNNDNNGGHG